MPYLKTTVTQQTPTEDLRFTGNLNSKSISQTCSITVTTKPLGYNSTVKCKVALKIPEKRIGYFTLCTVDGTTEYDTLTYDFGEIQNNSEHTHTFKFKILSDYSIDIFEDLAESILGGLVYVKLYTTDYNNNITNIAPWPTIPSPMWNITI